MTTVLIDFVGGKIFSDKRTTSTWGSVDNLHIFTDDSKKVITKKGFMFVFSGNAYDTKRFCDFYGSDSLPIPKEYTRSRVVVFNPDGEVILYQVRKVRFWLIFHKLQWSLASYLNDKKYFAIGSGAKYADDFMQVTSDPHIAMRAAAHFDEYTSFNYDVEEFPYKLKERPKVTSFLAKAIP